APSAGSPRHSSTAPAHTPPPPLPAAALLRLQTTLPGSGSADILSRSRSIPQSTAPLLPHSAAAALRSAAQGRSPHFPAAAGNAAPAVLSFPRQTDPCCRPVST